MKVYISGAITGVDNYRELFKLEAAVAVNCGIKAVLL